MYRLTATTSEVDISLGIVHSTLHNQLDYRKACACYMLNNLTHDHKAQCGTPYVSDTLHWSSGAVSTMHCYRGWCGSISQQPKPKHGNTHISPSKEMWNNTKVEKIMAIVILDHKGVPILDFPEHGDTIIAEYYFGTHERSQQACITKGLNCCLKAS
jgi:hypothetical protein